MENAIIVAILLVLLVVALLRVKKHFKGGCCSNAGSTVRIKKKLAGQKKGEKQLVLDGIRCENCAARVENGLNRLDGVSCRVHLKKKIAVVSYSVDISDEILKDAVEKLGYKVTVIR